MARERRLFSEEFKREVAKLVGQPGTSKAGIVRVLGVGANLLGAGAERPMYTGKRAAEKRFPAKSMSAYGMNRRRLRRRAAY